MQKIKKLFLLTIILIPLLAACSSLNESASILKYNQAIVKLPNGEIISGEIQDYGSTSDMINIVLKDGKGTYFTHASNVVLYNK